MKGSGGGGVEPKWLGHTVVAQSCSPNPQQLCYCGGMCYHGYSAIPPSPVCMVTGKERPSLAGVVRAPAAVQHTASKQSCDVSGLCSCLSLSTPAKHQCSIVQPVLSETSLCQNRRREGQVHEELFDSRNCKKAVARLGIIKFRR